MPGQQETEEQEFGSAFEEFAKGQSTPAAPVEAAPKPEPTPAPVAKADPAPVEPKAAEPEPLSIEQLQAQVRDAQHRERSASSRISTFTKESNQLKVRIAELEAALEAKAAKPAPDAAPAPTETDMLDEAPDLRAAVERRLKSAIGPLQSELAEARKALEETKAAAAEARQMVEPIGRKVQQETFEATWKALDERFTPQWRDDLRSEKFGGWIKQQSPHIQRLYNEAVTPGDSSAVVTLFYQDNGGLPAKPTPAAETPAAKPNQERLRLAAGINSRSAPTRTTGPAEDDFDGNFAEAMRQLKQA